MSGNEELKTVDVLLGKLRSGVKTTHEIKCRELVIPVRVLSIDEFNEVRRHSIAHATRSNGDETDKNLQAQKLTLKLASSITDGVPLLGDKILSQLTLDEINFLYEEYLAVMDSVNPSMASISDEEFREIVDALKKNLTSSRRLSLLQLRAICTAFAELIQKPEAPTAPTDS